MTHLPDEDMIFLNALADDELSGADKDLWLKRINEDADAKAAYECILSLKANLKNYTIQPKSMPETRVLPSSSSTHLWKIAASFLFVFALSGMAFFFFTQNSETPVELVEQQILDKNKTPFDWHSQFSKTHYDFTNIAPSNHKLALLNPDLKLPDLRASGLALVSTKVLQDNSTAPIQLLHYVGSSGCRLTVQLGPLHALDKNLQIPSLKTNFKNWIINETQIWVLASGMDKARFASITDYIQHYTNSSQHNYLSNLEDTMNEVYKNARSCG
ncbi:hypothetical protein NBRC116602_27340 [Hyphomicrobiales bacterium 4NK60-0047b]